jgi:hypothetical protein
MIVVAKLSREMGIPFMKLSHIPLTNTLKGTVMGIRDSEKPFMRTVILLCWRFCGSRRTVDDVVVMVDNRRVRIMVIVVVDGEVICGGLRWWCC